MDDSESFGDSNKPADELAINAVSTLMKTIQPGAMVQRFILVVETMDEDGKWINGFVAPGQKLWDTLGLMEYAKLAETSIFENGECTCDTEDDS